MVGFAANLMSKPWFLGYISKSEATMLLQQEPANTFIVRLHKSHRGTLACSYSSNRGVQHHVIQLDKSGYSMLNCEGSYPTLDELIARSSFLKLALNQLWMRSSHFIGEATKEEAELLLHDLNEGIYVVRLQSMLGASLTTNGLTPGSSTSSPPHSPVASSPPSPRPVQAISHAGPSSATHIHLPTISSSLLGTAGHHHNLRDTCFFVSVTSSAGSIKHFLIPCDQSGSVIVGGKSYVDLPHYLEQHKAIFSMPFAPSLPRFRSRLDSSIGSSSPSPTTSRFSSSSSSNSSGGNTGIMNILSSSSSTPNIIALSSSAGIPRFSVNGDSPTSPFTPTISQDDLSVPTSNFGIAQLVSSSPSPTPEDELPVIDIQSLSLPCSGFSNTNTRTAHHKKTWKPLTSQQLNPLDITYRDMWAELLRFYHVPVPEAKLPPKTAPVTR